jgi:hypothetical protein
MVRNVLANHSRGRGPQQIALTRTWRVAVGKIAALFRAEIDSIAPEPAAHHSPR